MLAEQGRLNFNLMLRENRAGWIGPYGRVNATHVRSYMPPVGDSTAILLLGGTQEMNELIPIVKEIGYENIVETMQSSNA